MKRKTALLYDPYLDVMGGGERHILSILKVLEEEGYSPTVIWNSDLSSAIKNQLHIEFKALRFHSNILTHDNNVFTKLPFLRQFDIFIYVTNGSYFFSSAKKNFVFSMYPKPELYRKTFLSRLKLFNYKFFSNSKFTAQRLDKFGIHSQIIYPYIDANFLHMDIGQKQKMILTVGRFFKQLHAKRQDIAIKYFLDLKKKSPVLKDYKLVLAGGLKDEDKEYFAELHSLSKGDSSIIFKPNIKFDELLDLYKSAQMYWHFAGYGIDEDKNPDLVEHLGITPLEGMSSGCLTFCYRAGGPKEIITNKKNGFLFSTQEELLSNVEEILGDKRKQQEIQINAKQFVKDNFSYTVFKERVKKVILS